MCPDMIKMQISPRKEELQAQRESLDSEIAHAWHRLTKVEAGGAFHERYAARGKIDEGESDARTILCPLHPCSPYLSVLYSVGKEETFGLRFEPIS